MRVFMAAGVRLIRARDRDFDHFGAAACADCANLLFLNLHLLFLFLEAEQAALVDFDLGCDCVVFGSD